MTSFEITRADVVAFSDGRLDCTCCDANLLGRNDWEPFGSFVNGEFVHLRVCFACLTEFAELDAVEFNHDAQEVYLPCNCGIERWEQFTNEVLDDYAESEYEESDTVCG